MMMNSADDIKLSLRLLNTFFMLILYIHFTACIWFFFCSLDEQWLPGPHAYYSIKVAQLFDEDTSIETKYVISFYISIIALTGNDIYPIGNPLFIIASLLIICGALMNANLFGSISVIFQQLNRKRQRLQEQIDIANTSMKNMKLP